MQLSFFYFLSFLAVLSAIMVIALKNPIYSAIFMVLTFVAICGHYLLLNAQFLAIVHFIVYLGAIMVLFLFTIMFLNLNSETEPNTKPLLTIAGIVSGGLLFFIFVVAFKDAAAITNPTPDMGIGLIKNLGVVLFRDFLLPFELISVLFLAALIGAVMLGKKETGTEV